MNETLGQKQERFSRIHPLLISKALEIWPHVRLGDLFRDPRVHGEMGVKMGYGQANSCHKLKLAQDINFIVTNAEGKEEIGGEAFHKVLHDWWDTQGGSKRIDNDMNHYSLEHNGYR